eukprot:scaffold663451_cov38-Prasinocladus_malaysianus.AAC.1
MKPTTCLKSSSTAPPGLLSRSSAVSARPSRAESAFQVRATAEPEVKAGVSANPPTHATQTY